MAAFIPNGFEGPNKTRQVRIFVVKKYEVSVPSCKQIVHFHKLWDSLQGRGDDAKESCGRCKLHVLKNSHFQVLAAFFIFDSLSPNMPSTWH